MPEAPRSVEEGIKAIRPSLRVVWNPKAKLLQKEKYVIATGDYTPPEYDGRWEIWDTDITGKDYRIMVVQHEDGSFKPLGDWLVERLKFVNPERWDGDPNKMLAALIDMEQDKREELMDRDFDTLAEATATWGAWSRMPKVMTASDARSGEWSGGDAKTVGTENNFEAMAADAKPAKPGSKILTP